PINLVLRFLADTAVLNWAGDKVQLQVSQKSLRQEAKRLRADFLNLRHGDSERLLSIERFWNADGCRQHTLQELVEAEAPSAQAKKQTPQASTREHDSKCICDYCQPTEDWHLLLRRLPRKIRTA
ncbi:MAG: hypothetical protein MK135_17865, partial [Polyangiaceae bacterium]|nr:hypothetical protein [Polyangiaceae bacterium]